MELFDLRDFSSISRLLSQEYDPNIQDGDDNTPFHHAAFMVQQHDDVSQVASVLIYFGANVNYMNNYRITPLHFALGRRNHKMIEFLVAVKAQIDLMDSDGNTGLHYAIHNCAVLMKGDPDYFCRSVSSSTAWRTVEQFFRYHPNINITNNGGETPLIWTLKAGDFPIAQELSQKGASPNHRDAHGNTVLHYALVQPEVNLDIFAELMSRGNYPNFRNDRYCSALYLYTNRLGIFSELMSRGSYPSFRNDRYCSSLYVYTNRLDIFAELMSRGSYPNFRNDRYCSALDLYINGLERPTLTERKKAKFILKLLLLKTRFSISDKIIELVGPKYIFDCRMEICVMQGDKLASGFSLYNLISWNFGAKKQHYSQYYDTILAKLLTGKYAIYSDVIVSYFPRRYLSRRFAEICWWQEQNNGRAEFLTYDLRFQISYCYLSCFDSYKIMLAGKGVI